MERYFFEPDADQDYHIFDRTIGHSDRGIPVTKSKAIARKVDPVLAQRIVNLLNADERLKEQAALAKRRAVE